MLFSWLRKLKKPIRARQRSGSRFAPALEVLEDRVLLTAPTVSSTVPDILTNQTTLTAGMKSLKVTYSSTVVGGGTVSNYDLRNLGPDGVRDSADDIVAPLTVTYSGSTASL